jgi:hypothetical protein
MTTKTKTITVAYGWQIDSVQTGFLIEKLTDSTEYYPGQVLTKPQVDSLCANRYWKVTIVPYVRGAKLTAAEYGAALHILKPASGK